MTPESLLEQEFGLVAEVIAAHARERPAHPALIEGDEVLTYGELDALMNRIAASMQRDGLRSGDVIAICGSASVQYGAVFLGALRAGVAVAPLPPSATADSLLTMLADCGAKLFFLSASMDSGLGARGTGPKRIYLSSFLHEPHAPSPESSATSLSSWLAPASTTPVRVSVDPDAAFNIIYSSGTTGTPKGIVQPHRMRWVHVRRAAGSGYDRQAVTLCSTPLCSNTALVSLFPALAGGGTVVLMRKFDAAEFLALAAQHRVTHAMLVPVQYQRIMDLPDFDRYDLSRFRMKFCTSAPFAASLKADILKRWPGGLIEYYGMSEGGGTCMLVVHEHPDKLHTVGQPAPGHEIRLIDESGNAVPTGEVGEIVGRSGAMMKHYHNQPAKTSEAEWYDAQGNRFIRTGDMGRFDADGFLTLMDRKKDMIISGGFNIYPSDLEAVLSQHEAVREGAVAGVASREWGETPVAFVVLKENRSASAEQIRDWVNQRVGKIQRLAAVEILPSLPRGIIGKVLKRELRERYMARAQALCN
jgi:acyl-CoA synthetase (AMP-forming)/AMP-acid ligase II